MSDEAPSTVDPVDTPNEPKPDAAAGFNVVSLRPAYSSPDHELYVSYLLTELRKPAQADMDSESKDESSTRPHNLALTGSYGSGKSSILSKATKELGPRAVSVSMSTLGSEEVRRPKQKPSDDPLETSPITNAIQKEIVKQLLYREKPRSVPGSRYKRIEGFRHGRAFGLAAIIAGVLTSVVYLTGWLGRIEKLFADQPWLIGASYALLFVLVTLGAWGVQHIFQNRRVEQVTSGPASVSLADKSDSFFDKYLDELVYFFEVNGYDVVVFEDLDRFNDPYIFETLRELNTLLNNSKQITPRVITFVYAIKDSIFEQLGALSINGEKLPLDEVRQLAVTNRTKFFDLVIPVVPFISHRNARDLLGSRMKASGFIIERPLLDVVSKHLVDMRLIKNVHNEYGIFVQKILGPGGVGELDQQRLFAMIVYKNLNMADFEKIKEGTSALDGVYNDYRILVNQQIDKADDVKRVTQARLNRLQTIDSRSQRLGQHLEQHIALLLKPAGAAPEQAEFALSTARDVSELRTAGFWTEWLTDPTVDLSISYSRPASAPGYYGLRQVRVTDSLSIADVRAALNDELILEDWSAGDAAPLREEIRKATELGDFLKRATIADVLGRPELTVDYEGASVSLATSAEARLGKGLALDLLRGGFIDRNFTLYVSLYYDDTVTAQARNFLLHTVDPNTIDANALIGSGDEIEAMLIDSGEQIFRERSIYNTQIFDYLLSRNDVRFEDTARRLARDGNDEREFLRTYLSSGGNAEALIARVAPYWQKTLLRVLEDESLDDARRALLLDSALASLFGDGYDATAELGEFISSNLERLTSLTGKRNVRSFEAIAGVLADSNVRFQTLSALAAELIPLAVAKSLYVLSETNLVTALGGTTNLSLNSIQSVSNDVYQYVLDHITEYLVIEQASVNTGHTIDDQTKFVEIVNDLSEADTADIQMVIERADGVTIVKIGAVKEKLWPLIAADGRLKVNFNNVAQYLDKRGSVDEALAGSLSGASAIVDSEDADDPERRVVALAIINSPHLAPAKRVELVVSLELTTVLNVSELTFGASGSDLAGPMLTAGLLGDSPEVFAALESEGWTTQRSYMLASSALITYIDAIDFSQAGLQSLVQDPLTPDALKLVILKDMDTYVSALNAPAKKALASYGADHEVALDAGELRRLAPIADAEDLIRLIDLVIDSLSTDDLVAILALMQYKYKRLTELKGYTTIPTTAENERLVRRLKRDRVISSFDDPPSGSQFRVNLFKKAER